MNGRGAGPLSPVSIGGSEWSGISKYQNQENEPYSPNPRGQLISPPISSGSQGTMNGGGFPRGPGDSPSNGPSPPASIARSSNGASLYNGTTLYANSDDGRSRKDDFQGVLAEHYTALKKYLAASLRDEKGNPRPNKARDKLLRLSGVQFQELSTDVFDELLRRQAAGRRTPNGGPQENTPAFLLPKDTFHPKRNQARQKLSTLPPPRFRDLATDVFYELERRFPRFAGGDISRTDSPASMRGPNRSMTGTPNDPMRPGSRGGPGGPRMRRPSEASSMSQFPRTDSRNGSRMGGPGSNLGTPTSPSIPPNDYGRPLAKTTQSNTIVPNKSTMVEDDDSEAIDDNDDDGDAFGLESAARTKSVVNGTADKQLIEEYQTQVAAMKEKLEVTEEQLKQKDEELNNVMDRERNGASASNAEKQSWSELRLKLEDQLSDATNLNESLQSKLDQVRLEHSNVERELRAQIEQLRLTSGSKASSGNDEIERENQELRADLLEQQQITDEVRQQAEEFLSEMRILTERSGSSWEKEEQLSQQVLKLEDEVRDWRNRYAKTKTQLRSLRASSIGLTIQTNAAQYAKDSGFHQEDGLVTDVHITKFQISIDELLRVARGDDPTKVVDYMKSVVVSVRDITQDIDESKQSAVSPEQAKLKSRVSATANNLITASKNYASAKGLSPVSLLDAAASHLTTSVVELVRTVKIRPTPAGELEDDDDGNLPAVDPTGYFPQPGMQAEVPVPAFNGLGNRQSAVSSMYSPVNSPRQSVSNMPQIPSGQDWSSKRPTSRNGIPVNGMNRMNGGGKTLPPAPVGFGIRTQDSDVEELKIYLEDQTALLVQTIQSLVSSIRSEAGITAITTELSSIASVVGKVVTSTETAMASTGNSALRTEGDSIVKKLSNARQRLLAAGDRGREIADSEDDGRSEMDWRVWTQSLPPIAFEIARETKELVQRVDIIDGGGNDFS